MTLNFTEDNLKLGGNSNGAFTFFKRGFKLGGSGVSPSWQDIIISGNTALTLVNAKADGLNYLKLYGKTIQESVTLPTGYTRLDYLQSNGNQYINTYIRALQRRALQIDFQYLTTPNATSYVGGEIMKGSGTSLTSMMTIGVYGSNKIVVRFSDNAVNTNIDCGTARHVVKVAEGTWEVDGVTGTFTPSGTISSSAYNIYLFGANRVNALFGSDPVRIFNAKIWDADELRQDWYPCRRDSDGTLGMYDIVNGTFRTNAGTGTFTAGADYAPNTTEAEHIKLNYIRATGTQYINTGYTPVIGDEISIKYRFTTVASDDSAFYCLLSAGASSNVNDYQLIMIEGKSTSIPAGGFFYKYFANGSATTLSFSPVANTWYTANITSNGTLTTGGVSATSTPAGEISGDDKNLYLFVRANMASPFLGDIAELTITNNNVTKLHLIPVKRKVDSAICMYDTVTGTYIYNAGTGTFESGGSALTDVARIICNNGELKVNTGFLTADVIRDGYGINSSNGSATANSSRCYIYPFEIKAGDVVELSTTAPSLIGGNLFLYNSATVNQANFLEAVSASNERQINGRYVRTATATRNGYASWQGLANEATLLNAGLALNVNKTYGGIVEDGTTETVKDSLNNTATAENLYGITNGTNTFTDVQEVLTGAISRNVGVKVFDGTETWTYQSVNSRFFCDVGLKIVGNRTCPLLCTHYQAIIDGRALANVPDYSVYGATSNNSVYLHDSRFTSENALKNYLKEQYNAGTPVILIFPLATPTTETVTGQTLTTQRGTNVIEITQASIDGLPLEVSYKAGVTVTVTEVENANLDNSVTVTIGE